jgi:hypothetical protein
MSLTYRQHKALRAIRHTEDSDVWKWTFRLIALCALCVIFGVA